MRCWRSANASITAWPAPATTARDKKELPRASARRAGVAAFRDECRVHLTLRWRDGKLTELDVGLPRSSRPATVRTGEDTLALLRRLAMPYPDAVIRWHPQPTGPDHGTGLRFAANAVGNLRRHWQIPRFEPSAESSGGELLSLQQAGEVLGMAPPTLHRWINDGFIAGEQADTWRSWQYSPDR